MASLRHIRFNGILHVNKCFNVKIEYYNFACYTSNLANKLALFLGDGIVGDYLKFNVVTCMSAGDFIMINCDVISYLVVKTQMLSL